MIKLILGAYRYLGTCNVDLLDTTGMIFYGAHVYSLTFNRAMLRNVRAMPR